jgi:hypothetical protein
MMFVRHVRLNVLLVLDRVTFVLLVRVTIEELSIICVLVLLDTMMIISILIVFSVIQNVSLVLRIHLIALSALLRREEAKFYRVLVLRVILKKI